LAAAYGDGICCAKTIILESIPSTLLNGSLRNFNTLRVSVGNITLRRDFWVLAPKIWAPKLPMFDDFVTVLWANICGEKHDIDNRETANYIRSIYRPKIS